MKRRAISALLAILLILQALPAGVAFAETEPVISNTQRAAAFYTVSFVVEEGEAPAARFYDAQADKMLGELPAAPAVDGMTFMGWFLPDREEPVDASTAVLADMTLTARYEASESAPLMKAPAKDSAFFYSDQGAYSQVTVSGTYKKNQVPAATRASLTGGAGETVLEAWTVAGIKNNTSLTAELTISALPELAEGESVAVYSVTGASLTALVRDGVQAGDSVSVALAFKGASGIALVKRGAAQEEAPELVDGSVIWANEDLYLTGKMPGSAVVAAEPVTVAIDGAETLLAYDISIYANANQQAKGKTWQPAGDKVQVHLRSDRFAAEELYVYHIADGKTEFVEAVEPREGWVEFGAESFSVYAVAGKITEKYLATDGNLYSITVAYGAEAGIPEGAQLSVTELDGAEYLNEAARALNWTDADEVFYTRFFDISIVKDGVKVVPGAAVEVTVELMDVSEGAEALQVVHFGKEGAEELASTATAEGVVTFETDSFSAFGFGSILKPLATWSIDVNASAPAGGVRLQSAKSASPASTVDVSLMGFSNSQSPVWTDTTVELEEGLEQLGAYTLSSEEDLAGGPSTMWVKVAAGSGLSLGDAESLSVYGLSDGSVAEVLSENVGSGATPLALGDADGFAVVLDSGYRHKSFTLDNVSLDGMMPKEVEAAASEAEPEELAGELLAAYDITITDSGADYQPDAEHPVGVTITDMNILGAENVRVLHILDDGTQEEIPEFTVSGDTVSFEAKGFSIYAVVGETKRLVYKFHYGTQIVATEYVRKYEPENGDEPTYGELYDPGLVPEYGQKFVGWALSPTETDPTKIYSIDQLNAQVRTALDGEFEDLDTYDYYAITEKAYFLRYLYMNDDGTVTTLDTIVKAEDESEADRTIAINKEVDLSQSEIYQGWYDPVEPRVYSPNLYVSENPTYDTIVLDRHLDLYLKLQGRFWLVFDANAGGAGSGTTDPFTSL